MSLPFKLARTTSDEADLERRAAHGERSRARIGIIGVVVTVLAVICALQMDKLPFLSNGSVYTSYFDDAGGLEKGDSVILAGVNVGTVQDISLSKTRQGTKAKVKFNMADNLRVGDQSQVAIKTETLLGRRNITVIPRPSNSQLKPGDSLPVGNSVSPYSLTDALQSATTTVADTNFDQLNSSIDTLSQTFAGTPPQVRSAVDGISRLSKAINDRDEALRSLLGKANSVTEVIKNRSGQINTLVTSANSLLGELQYRQQAIGSLITGAKNVSLQLSGFINDNNAQLSPVLARLNKVVKILEDNQGNIKQALARLGPFQNVLGEAVANGPYFNAFAAIPTLGDYTGAFMAGFAQRFPEAYATLTKYAMGGFLQPDALTIKPGPEADPKIKMPDGVPPTYPKAPGER